MGWNTTVVIMNDALHDIAHDERFGVHLADAVVSGFGRRGVDVPAGCHCNAARVIEQHHADGLVPVLVGGNDGTVLGVALPWATKAEEMELALLRELARKHGYGLRRKKSP